jgi:GWxTD domain-containing protein
MLPWLSPMWLLGVLVFGLRNLASWFAAQRMRRRGVCAPPEAWQTRLDALRRRFGISGSVELLESCFIHVPVVIGYLRPVILVPVGLLAGLPPAHMEMILMHELQHVRRRDYLVNVLQTCIESAMFYNPCVWWISRTVRTEREHCCDDLVVKATGDAHAYAAALTALEESRRGAQLALAANGGSLMLRIHRLLRQPRPGNTVLPILLATLVVVVSAMLLSASAVPQENAPIQPRIAITVGSVREPVEPAAGPSIQPAVRAGQSDNAAAAFMRWLDQDVAYIISNEERFAFVQLRNNEEREQFVEQFWQRRDPTPATAENEFKEEHYRRIAYANARFGASEKAGWTSDRGRVYIMWGRPGELESHIADPNGPFELWLYPHVEGVGDNVLLRFVDATGAGDFRLADMPDNSK